MTSIFDETGKNIPCTVIEAGPCVVTQIRTEDTDGYAAIQLAYGDAKEKNTSAPLKGHFQKAGTAPKRRLVEFKTFPDEKNLGDTVTVDIFESGDVDPNTSSPHPSVRDPHRNAIEPGDVPDQQRVGDANDSRYWTEG